MTTGLDQHELRGETHFEINSFQRDILKALAVVAMICDHILLYSDWVDPSNPVYPILLIVGRWAFPVFAALAAFSVAQSKDTDTLWRMAIRLLFWALVAQACLQYSAFLHTGQTKPILLNVLFSFLFSLSPILAWKTIQSHIRGHRAIARVITSCLLCAMALQFISHTEYGVLGFLAGPFAYIAWKVINPAPVKLPASLFFLLLATFLIIFANDVWGAALLLPVILVLYAAWFFSTNNADGCQKRIFSKHFLYAFYALHTIPIALL